MSVAPFTKVGSQLLVDGAMYTETGGVVLADTGAPCAVTVGPVVAPFDEAEYFATQVRAILRKYGANAHVWMPGPGVPVLGPELISNGDFSNGTVGWVITGGSAPYGVSAVGGELSFSGSASWVNVRKLDVLTIGKTYQCTYTVKSRSAGSVRFNGGGFLGTFRTAPGTYTEVFTATEHGHFSMQHGGDLVATIDDVSVKELLGYSTLLNGFQAANYLMENATGSPIAAAPQVVDQPVGYVGDAALPGLGPEKLLNWDFGGGTTSWAALQGASLSVTDGVITVTATAAQYAGASQTVSTVAGETYLIKWRASRPVGPCWIIISGGVGGVINNIIPSATMEDGQKVVVAAGTTITVTIQTQNAVGTVALCDYISIKKMDGIPATQSATSNKPFLRRGHVNRIRNSTMQGAVVGTPGTLPTNWAVNVSAGLSTHVVAKGVEDGLDYIDLRIFGTASGSTWNMHFDSVTAIDTVVGTNWTAAVNVRMVGGSAAGITAIGTCPRFGQSAGSVTNATPALVALTSSYSRLTRTDTGAANTAKITQRLDMNITNGAAIDVTIRIAAPQLETGSVANAFVPTTTAAASSNTGGYWWEFGMEATPNDSFALAAPPFQVQDDFAIVSAFKASPNFSENKRIFGSTGGSAAIDLLVNHTTGTINAKIADSAGVTTWPSAPVGDTFNKNVVASVRKTGNVKAVRKDGVEAAPDTTALGTSSIGVANIGATGGATTSFFSGAIYAVIAIKGTVTDADLKILEKWVGQQAGVQIV